jgi:methylaspartate ammonia-lyase
MTRITDVICSPGATGFFFDDQKAIKAGATGDGFMYVGSPKTPGFRAIRQAGESISVMLVLDDGQVAFGDCASIQYSGAGGRDPLFLARDFIPVIERVVKPRLVGRELSAFRPLVAELEALQDGGRGLHSAIRYGVSQAVLDGVARAGRRLPCEVLAAEYSLALERSPVRIFAQSGDDRYVNVDKMILKAVEVLPHALINNVPDKLGADGGKLLEYVVWLRERILRWRASESYVPELHIDVYGTTGMIFANDAARIGEYLARLGQAARPFALRVEGPVDMGERAAQYAKLLEIRNFLRARGVPVGIVADEWCNSLEDIRAIADMGAVDMVQIKTPVLGGIQNSLESVLYCKSRGVLAYLGGTCNETERSAQLCVHVALASRPHQMLAKPGMGTDEGIMVVRNEMSRALEILGRRP